MIDNFIHVKVIESLRMRKKAVEKSYSLAGWVGFWVPVALLGIQVFYYVCRQLVNDMGAVAVIMGGEIIESRLYWEFNYPPMIACLVFTLLGYFAFGSRRRGAQYLFMAGAIVFIIVSFIMIMKNYEKITYTVAIIYCTAMIFVCADCIKAYKEDKLLSGIYGYPHFNAILMNEERSEEKSLLRFPDKKSYEQLYDERMEEYAKDNPDAPMSRLYMKEKEERADNELSDWLSGMMKKTEEN